MRQGIQARIAAGCGLLMFAGSAWAQWRCDCSSIVGSCAATAEVRESFIEVSSNVAQCSRVDYIVDGQPLVALVVDGTARQDWIARSESPSIIVESCQICVDNSGTASESSFGSSLISEGEPTRLIGVEPAYPEAAAAAGIEGHVDVAFTIALDGTVTNAEVVAAEPAGVFENAALAAVSRWRYTRPAEAPLSHSERVEFSLGDDILSLTPATGLDRVAARPTEPLRNSCIREETRYDFGGAIDISFMNACESPLVVYHCAGGTGPNASLWICGGTDDAVDRLELTRAPNSEIWWLACGAGDAGCRDEGQNWVRSMNRQAANVNPQDRTRARLARSF